MKFPQLSFLQMTVDTKVTPLIIYFSMFFSSLSSSLMGERLIELTLTSSMCMKVLFEGRNGLPLFLHLDATNATIHGLSLFTNGEGGRGRFNSPSITFLDVLECWSGMRGSLSSILVLS